MRHATVAATAAALLLISAAPAAAGGSDDPVPYTVGAHGLALPGGDVFDDGGHVNIRYTTAAGAQAANIHFETRNGQRSGRYVDTSYLPWSALVGADPGELCITWVQVAGYDEHFGEGGQEPVCTTVAEPAPEPSGPIEPSGPPATAESTPTPPDAETPAPGTSSPAAPQEETTEGAAVPGAEAGTPDAGSDDDGRSTAEGPVESRPDTGPDTSPDNPATDDVVAAALPATGADAPEQAAEDGSDGSAAAADQLPRTGAAVVGLAVAAAALLAAGAALLLARRRRRV